jgi:hypothetical protein
MNVGDSMRLLSLSLLLVVALSACKKKPADEALINTTPAPAVPGALPALPLDEAAARLGFAKHLPADTEAYVGILNVGKHAAALKASTWGAEVLAFINDKIPAASAGSADPMQVLSQLWSNDVSLALGKGSAASLKPWQALATIVDELRYRTLLQGTLPTAAGTKDSGIAAQVAMVMSDPDLIARVQRIVNELTLPPLTIAIRGDDPQAVLATLVPGSLLKELRDKAKVSQLTTKGSTFTLITGTMGMFITSDMAAQWMSTLPKDGSAIATAQSLIDTLRAKPVHLAYGAAYGHAIITLGSESPTVEFSDDAAKSWLASPDAEFLLPFAQRNLAGVFYMQADVIAAVRKSEPFQPVARGLLAALKQSPVFADMAKRLEPKVEKLAALEHDLQSRQPTTAAAAAYWDQGLHLELKGGTSTEGHDAKAPLQLAPLIDAADNVFAITYHSDPAMSAKVRALIEGWSALLKEAAKGLVDSGLGGDQGPEIVKWVEADVLPPLTQLYEHTFQLYDQGTGNDHAWIVDLAGQKPALLAALGSGGTKMLRIAGVDAVADRAAIATHWLSIQQAVNALLKAFPQTTALTMPEPSSTPQVAGLTSYTYSLMPGAEDLSPTASISNKLLFIGTSAKQHADLAKLLLHAEVPSEPASMRWRLNLPALRAAVGEFTTQSPTGTNADQFSMVTRWLAPFGVSQGRTWIEAGHVRTSVHIEAKDVKRFE